MFQNAQIKLLQVIFQLFYQISLYFTPPTYFRKYYITEGE